MSSLQVRCPQCHTLSGYTTANKWRPFCSERCKMIDLGAWASDAYSIVGKAIEGDDALEQPLLDDNEQRVVGGTPSPNQH